MQTEKRRVLPEIVPLSEWEAAHERIRILEKEATRARDALAAERRRLPMVRIEKHYTFEGPGGKATIQDLFEGRRQLIIYNFMFAPAVLCLQTTLDTSPIYTPATRHSPWCREHRWQILRDTRSAWAGRFHGSPPPAPALTPISAPTIGKGESNRLTVLLKEEDDVFKTYVTLGRGVESIGSNWSFLDLTPFGRQEDWEDSPEGWPQTPPYAWWRRHDEY